MKKKMIIQTLNASTTNCVNDKVIYEAPRLYTGCVTGTAENTDCNYIVNSNNASENNIHQDMSEEENIENSLLEGGEIKNGTCTSDVLYDKNGTNGATDNMCNSFNSSNDINDNYSGRKCEESEKNSYEQQLFLSSVDSSDKNSTISSKKEYTEIIQNIINFNKNKFELNLSRGELYLTEEEYIFISSFLNSSKFRFYSIEDMIKKNKKKRDIYNNNMTVEESYSTNYKRSKSDITFYARNNIYNNNYNNYNDKHGYPSDKNSTYSDINCSMNEIIEEYNNINNKLSNYNTSTILLDNINNISLNKLQEGNKKSKNELTDNITMNDKDGLTCGISNSSSCSSKTKMELCNDKELSAEEKEQIELCEEVIIQLKKYYYDRIMNLESHFNNLDDKIEHNNFFYFNCIMDKL
ncbi:conserved protein, unknown function, partial [Hepatocystis sp. ex Piliocolobus tephrosceles]